MSIDRAGRLLQFRKRPFRSERGVSLLELIAFIAIVGAALAGILSVLNLTAGRSADPMIRKQMLAIAESLLEEVEAQPFTYCDPNDANATTATSTAGCATLTQGFGRPSGVVGAAAARSLYNNVGNYCDVDGTVHATCPATPALVLGTASSPASKIDDLTKTGASASPPGYWATIELSAVETLGGIASVSTIAGMEVMRIKVTVACIYTSETIALEGYRTRWMPIIR